MQPDCDGDPVHNNADYCAHYLYRQLRQHSEHSLAHHLNVSQQQAMDWLDAQLADLPVCKKLGVIFADGELQPPLSKHDHREFLELLRALMEHSNDELRALKTTSTPALRYYIRIVGQELGIEAPAALRRNEEAAMARR